MTSCTLAFMGCPGRLCHGRPLALKPGGRKAKRRGAPRAHGQPQDQPGAEEAVLCRQCQSPITRVDQRRVVDGAHLHTFANPQGILYEIACYGDVWGCGYLGSASAEFTWFAGHVWHIAVCARCRIHLGWRFSAADGGSFHGLITSRIQTGRIS